MIQPFSLQPVAESLLRKLVREDLQPGGSSYLLLTPGGYLPSFLQEAHAEQMVYFNPLMRKIAEEFYVDIRITDTRASRPLHPF